jgi:flagellar biosynthesis protein FlhB
MGLELPTQAEQQELRDAGIVPYSKVSTFCIATLALIFCLLGSRRDMDNFISATSSLWSIDGANLPIHQLGNEALSLVLKPACAIMFFRLLFALFQTKFLVRFASPLKTDLTPERKHSSRLLSFIINCTIPVIASGLALVTLLFIGKEVSGLLNRDIKFLLTWPSLFLKRTMPFVILGLTVLAFASWISSRYHFLRLYRTNKRGPYHDSNVAE